MRGIKERKFEQVFSRQSKNIKQNIYYQTHPHSVTCLGNVMIIKKKVNIMWNAISRYNC